MAMAQTIITLCDLHLSQGVEVVGESYTVGLSIPGESKELKRTLDLCPDCAQMIDQLRAVITEHGRAPEPNNVAERLCPVCGFVSVSTAGLSSHARSMHDTTLAELRGRDLPYGCPECERRFATPQGVGAHAFRAHGRKSVVHAANGNHNGHNGHSEPAKPEVQAAPKRRSRKRAVSD